MAFKGMPNYGLALKDFEKALKLFPNEKDAQNMKRLPEEEIELEERISKIQEDASGGGSMEFMEFLVKLGKGQVDGVD